MRNAQRAAETGDILRLGPAAGPQSMIDGRHMKRATEASGRSQLRGSQKQSQGVRPARDTQEQRPLPPPGRQGPKGAQDILAESQARIAATLCIARQGETQGCQLQRAVFSSA